MNKRFKLIPENLWRQIREGGGQHNDNDNNSNAATVVAAAAAAAPPLFNVDVINVDNSSSDPSSFEKIIDDLPKQCRRKSRTILNYIGNSLKLDKNMRLLYPDGTCGGHIADLLQWTTCTRMLADKMERPLDSNPWIKLLCTHNVPPSCYKDRMQGNNQQTDADDLSKKKKQKKRKKTKKIKTWLSKVP